MPRVWKDKATGPLERPVDTLHKDINTTRIYLRLYDEDVKREVSC